MELSSELRHLLREITTEFEENLRRAFRNEAVRRQALKNRKNEDHHHLDDVLVNVDGTIIEMKELVFVWVPDFRITALNVELGMLSIDLALNLGDIRIEGKTEVTNEPLQSILPISPNGNIVFTLENMVAEGRVGMIIQEDSFVPLNYDIKYSPKNVHLAVNYFGDKGNLVENEINRPSIETTLVKTFWVQLTQTLNQLLHRQLAAVVVEFSVTEMLIDKDEELREHVRHHATKANRLLDSLLCTAKDYLVAKNSRSVETPPFSVLFKRKPTGGSHGTFQTDPGYIRDLSTLTRTQDMSLYEDGQKLIVYGFLKMREFKHGYEKYTSEYEETRIVGDIKSTIYQNKIFVKIALLKDREDCSAHLETIQLQTVKDIDMDVSGLASLSWLNDKIGSWLVGTLRNRAIPVLEKLITESFNHALKLTDCVALLID